jgi:hypothetical protein
MPGNPKSVFESIDLSFEVSSPDATLEATNEIVQAHKCSVVCNLEGVTKVRSTVALKRQRIESQEFQLPRHLRREGNVEEGVIG